VCSEKLSLSFTRKRVMRDLVFAKNQNGNLIQDGDENIFSFSHNKLPCQFCGLATLILFYYSVMVHTNATNFRTNSFTSLQTRILAQKNRQRIRPF
jgi:hypothetical protein